MSGDLGGVSLSKSIRVLAAAIWCLAGVLLAFLTFYALSVFRPQAVWGQRPSVGAASGSGTSTPMLRRPPTESGFFGLTPADKIKRASAILITGWKTDGAAVKEVVTEVVKREPGTELYYSVGDEYSHGAEMHRDAYGDGEVVLMLGSPAEMRESFSFEGGRIGGMGDMPLTKFRELAKLSQ